MRHHWRLWTQANGGLGGPEFGYNLQRDQLVFGLEADFQGSGIKGSEFLPGPVFNNVGGTTCTPCNYSASENIKWFGTVRPRVGWAVDHTLIYATGGLIYGRVTGSQFYNFTGTPNGWPGSFAATKAGWTAGGGIEYALPGTLSQWSVKLEGLYFNLGDITNVASPVGAAGPEFTDFKTFGFQGAIVRGGLNLRFM